MFYGNAAAESVCPLLALALRLVKSKLTGDIGLTYIEVDDIHLKNIVSNHGVSMCNMVNGLEYDTRSTSLC